MTAPASRAAGAPFTPVSLTLATNSETLATARHEATAEILMGEGLRRIIAERMSQVTDHGHTPDTDLLHQGAELALASKSYLDTYVDLELRPDLARSAGDFPESWPFAHLYWKEPRAEDRAHALIKAIALAWAELDRLLAAQSILHAARPLAGDEA